MFEMIGTEHPAARIRRTALLTCVALLLVLRDVWRMRGWAGEARQIERDARRRHAEELHDEDSRHLERIRQLHAEINALRSTSAGGAAAAEPVVIDADELV